MQEKRVKAHYLVQACFWQSVLHNRTEVGERSWTDGLTNGTISTVFINNTEETLGSQHYSKQCKRRGEGIPPCLMGSTKESVIKTLQQYKVVNQSHKGLLIFLGPREITLPSQQFPAKRKKRQGMGKGRDREYNLARCMDTWALTVQIKGPMADKGLGKGDLV